MFHSECNIFKELNIVSDKTTVYNLNLSNGLLFGGEKRMIYS